MRWEASQHPESPTSIVTDAAFNPAKQVSDIEDLLRQDIGLLIYWPVDDGDRRVLKRRSSRRSTVKAGGGFTDMPGTVSNAYISQWKLGEMVARQLMADLGGKGKIVAMLPIAGTTAAVDQLDALETVLKEYPGVELLSAEYGDWNRAKAKQITENLLQRFPEIDGVFSPAGQMSIGVAEAFDEAGRLGEVDHVAGRRVQRLDEVGRQEQAGRRRHLPDARRPGGGEDRRWRSSKGEPVTRGTAVPSAYIAPADIAQICRRRQARTTGGRASCRPSSCRSSDGQDRRHAAAGDRGLAKRFPGVVALERRGLLRRTPARSTPSSAPTAPANRR